MRVGTNKEEILCSWLFVADFFMDITEELAMNRGRSEKGFFVFKNSFI